MGLPVFNDSLPLYNSGLFNNQPWTPVISSSSSSSNSTSNETATTKKETYEEWREKQAKNTEEKAFLEERNKEVTRTQELLDAQRKMINDIKKAQNDDSGKTIIENYKLTQPEVTKDGKVKKAKKPKESEKGFWAKVGEWAGSAWSTVKSMGKAIAGIDENGKWHPKRLIGIDENGKFDPMKCTLGITALLAVTSFTPAGPFVMGALSAYGLGNAAYGAIKGSEELSHADTPEEKEQARQNICASVITGVLSAIGLKGSVQGITSSLKSSAAATSSSTTATASAATSSSASSTASAASATASAAGRTTAATASTASKTGFFAKTWENMKNSWNKYNSWNHRYNSSYTELEGSLQSKLANINEQINNLRTTSGPSLTNAQQKTLVLLKEEQDLITKNISELQRHFAGTKPKADYDKLLSQNTSHKALKRISNRNASQNPNKIRGKSFTQEELHTFYNRIIKDQKSYSKSLKKLVKAKECQMRTMAKHPDKNMAELSQYIPNPTASKSFWKPSTWTKNEYQLAIGGKNPSKFWETSKTVLTSPPMIAPVTYAQWNRDFTIPDFGGELTKLSAQQTEEILITLEKQKAELESSLNILNDVKDAKGWNELKLKAQA